MKPIENLIAEALGISAQKVRDDLEFGAIPQWDSTNHVNLILSLEEAYGVEIEAEKIVELTSVTAIRNFAEECGG